MNFGSGNQLVNGLSAELLAEEPHATIFKVIGADTALRYKSELKGPTVVVCREGSTEALHSALSNLRPDRKTLLVAEELPGEECSSTKLRGALRAADATAVRQMCPAAVAEYLLTNREELFWCRGASSEGGFTSTLDHHSAQASQGLGLRS